MSATVIELAEIKLAPGKSEADLIAASNRFQEEFLKDQPGFLGRDLTRRENGDYADLVRWADRASADAIMARARQSPACAAYFAVMRMDAGDPSEGVRHFDVLAAYPA